MGFSLGGNSSSSSNTANTAQNVNKSENGSASTQYQYSPEQSGLQSNLMQVLTQLITGGGSSPQVTQAQNASASQINSTYAAAGDRTNRFLAQRGFAKSGQAGDVALKTELGRQGALAQNSAAYGMKGLDLFQQGLSDALAAAFKQTGQTASTSGTSSTDMTGSSNSKGSSSGFNWGVEAKPIGY